MISGFKLIGLNILSDSMTKFFGQKFHAATLFSVQVIVASVWSLSIWFKLGFAYYFTHLICVVLSVIQFLLALAKKPLNEFWTAFSILVFVVWIMSMVYETYPNLIADLKTHFKNEFDGLTKGAEADDVEICKNAAEIGIAENGDGVGGDLDGAAGDLELAEALDNLVEVCNSYT